MTLSDLKPRFQGHDIIQRQITEKRYQIELHCTGGPTDRKSYMVYLAQFLMNLNDPLLPVSRARLTLNISETVQNGILIGTGTYIRYTQQCHFE